MHSKDVKLATEESTGFDEVLHNTATPPPFLSERSTCCNLYPSDLRSPTTGSSFSLSQVSHVAQMSISFPTI